MVKNATVPYLLDFGLILINGSDFLPHFFISDGFNCFADA
jgi:hypothetical protein